MFNKKVYMLIGICCMGATLLPFSTAFAGEISKVNGKILHGKSLDIYGIGFGTKISNQAAPLKWEPFEDGTVGNDVASTGYWSEKITGDIRPVFSENNQRSPNSTLNIKHHQYAVGTNNYDVPPNMGMAQFWRNNIGFATTKKAYVNFWTRMDFGPTTSGMETTDPNGYQIKIARIVKEILDDSGNPGHNTMTTSFWTNTSISPRVASTNYEPYSVFRHSASQSMSDIIRGYTDADHVLAHQGWANISIQYSASSSAGAQDATYRLWLQRNNGDTYWTKGTSDCGSGRTCYFDSPVSAYYNTDQINALKIEYNFDNFESGHPDITSYTDDIYVDNSWARVEIGDKPKYEESTHREIQIPTAWATNKVSVKLNLGSFSTGKVYLYVVNEDGVVINSSNGFELTIGAIYSTYPPPSNPKGDGTL